MKKNLENLLEKVQEFLNEIVSKYDLDTMRVLVFETEKEFWENYHEFYNDYAKFLEYQQEFNDITVENSDENKSIKINEIREKIENEFDYIATIFSIYEKQLRENEIDYGLKKIQKYKNIFQKQKVQIENLKKNYKKISNEQREHDKKILEMMGIFLSIFSVIGLGFSSVLNLESDHTAIWLMMCGTILITMSGLFYLIDPNKFNKQEKNTENDKCKIEEFLKQLFNILRKPIIIGVILMLAGGVIRWKFPDDNEKLVKKQKLKQVEKVQNNENELLDKNLDYRNQIKDLKEEIKKLQSKVEELEKKK